MRKAAALLLLLLLAIPAPLAAGQKDAAGCNDHPLFPTRMPNYSIERCETKEFGSYAFFTPEGPRKPRTVEGKFTFITYRVDDKKDDRSALEVVRNYENALKKIGGTIAASDPNRRVNGFVTVDGKEVWAEAERGNGKIWLRIVERQAMAQTIVADAKALKDGLAATGHVTVEGIYFDTNKTEIKPSSAAAIGEIAKLLSTDAGLKVHVVGHTDTVGSVDSNMKLSQGRAEAVMQALVKEHGIAASRLRAFGNGPFAPVASNDTEEGRARNRRVELVKQ
jgi:outer membrane protein OmpA-like peptidoglycan-associated protein